MDTFSFQLALFSDTGKLTTLLLPGSPDGFYRFGESEEYRIVSIEARDGQWVACCNRPAYFKDVMPDLHQQIPLHDGQLLYIEYHDRYYMLFAEQISQTDMTFNNYPITTEAEITIGSSPESDICCSSPLISETHAILTRSQGVWHIRDSSNANGVYVNNSRVYDADLKMGDSIYIMGLRILIGSNFLGINDGGGRATVSQRVQKQNITHRGGYTHYSGDAVVEMGESYFNRPPRKHITLEENVIAVEGPPMSMQRAQMPLMLRMGSSLVMGGNAALNGNFTMLLTSVMFPFLTQRFSEKQRQEYEQRRNIKYNEYLDQKREAIEQACREEQKLLNIKYPALGEVIDQANQKIRLWERRPMDSDFMSLRVGYGEQPMRTELDYPRQRFELENDHLEDKMYQLVEAEYNISPVPIMTSFLEEPVCGVLGHRGQVLDFVQRMIMQTAILHSYDEVKMVFLGTPEEMQKLEFVRFLPHTWDDQKSIRFVATNEAEAYRLGEYIKSQMPEKLDEERSLEKGLKSRPYYMVFALDKKLYDSIEYLKDVLSLKQNHGVSLLAAFDDLPKECQTIFNLSPDGKHYVSNLRPDSSGQTFFTMDPCMVLPARQNMKMLANLSLKADAQTYELPKMITFLEMFQAGRVEHLNPLKRWRENNPVKSLAAPVGVAVDGSLFSLDLHEKRQGPHGLVAGMTGSGKSEFIITYILSMAINYHPDEVAFILIDYKGGGLAGAFENPRIGLKLPHLVGTITNLDGAAIQRSLMSIESEIMRRQRVFNEIKSATNEGTMDIYAYQKLYRAGKVEEPMPHLFIISDEFAELKKQQPEFMDKLISAARIGRSLGVHLILATQKPAGVVNDQIRSNTKFRVCLRVQDRMDSMDMLKRPEAAELTDTGRFYLQVGYNEFFALGQSAWCGASYEPRDTAISQKDDAIEFLDMTGQVLTKTKPRVKKTDSGMKQIMAVVQYLSDIAKREGYEAKSLWKEPLPLQLPVETLEQIYEAPKGYPIRALAGIVDDPERQDQYPMVQDVQNCQHLLIVGETGSGKTTLLQTLLYSLVRGYTPEQLNYSILDFSNKRLSAFRRMPHCGAYLTDEDEETFERFFEFIAEQVAERKKLFADADVSSYEGYIQKHPLPLILVVVHNLANLTGSKFGARMNWSEVLRESTGYGIKFVMTANFINEVNSKIKQEMGSRIALHAKDRFNYGEILNAKVPYLPKDCPGRGLCVMEERPLEFHGATVLEGDAAKIREALQMLAAQYAEYTPARRLPMLDPTETYEHYIAGFKPGRIPLGYVMQTVKPVALPLKQLFSLSLYFGNPIGVEPVMDNILTACIRQNMELIIVKRSAGSIFEGKTLATDRVTYLDSTPEGISALKDRLIKEATARKVIRDAACAQRGIDNTLPNAMELVADHMRSNTDALMIVFESFKDFCNNAPEDSRPIFQTVFTKGKGSNYYFVGCFYPDDAVSVGMNPVMKTFNADKLTMIFGGCLDRQGLVTLPREYQYLSDVSDKYNRCLMHYQSRFSQIQMPCGELVKPEEDEDSAPIF